MRLNMEFQGLEDAPHSHVRATQSGWESRPILSVQSCHSRLLPCFWIATAMASLFSEPAGHRWLPISIFESLCCSDGSVGKRINCASVRAPEGTSRSHIKGGTIVCICNPTAFMVTQEVETGKSLEACGPASLVICTGKTNKLGGG